MKWVEATEHFGRQTMLDNGWFEPRKQPPGVYVCVRAIREPHGGAIIYDANLVELLPGEEEENGDERTVWCLNAAYDGIAFLRPAKGELGGTILLAGGDGFAPNDMEDHLVVGMIPLYPWKADRFGFYDDVRSLSRGPRLPGEEEE